MQMGRNKKSQNTCFEGIFTVFGVLLKITRGFLFSGGVLFLVEVKINDCMMVTLGKDAVHIYIGPLTFVPPGSLSSRLCKSGPFPK